MLIERIWEPYCEVVKSDLPRIPYMTDTPCALGNTFAREALTSKIASASKRVIADHWVAHNHESDVDKTPHKPSPERRKTYRT